EIMDLNPVTVINTTNTPSVFFIIISFNVSSLRSKYTPKLPITGRSCQIKCSTNKNITDQRLYNAFFQKILDMYDSLKAVVLSDEELGYVVLSHPMQRFGGQFMSVDCFGM